MFSGNFTGQEFGHPLLELSLRGSNVRWVKKKHDFRRFNLGLYKVLVSKYKPGIFFVSLKYFRTETLASYRALELQHPARTHSHIKYLKKNFLYLPLWTRIMWRWKRRSRVLRIMVNELICNKFLVRQKESCGRFWRWVERQVNWRIKLVSTCQEQTFFFNCIEIERLFSLIKINVSSRWANILFISSRYLFFVCSAFEAD